jgi:hypothetical protein
MATSPPTSAPHRSPQGPIRVVPLRDDRLTAPAPAVAPGQAPSLTYRCTDVNDFARVVRSDHRPDPGPGLV